jgi:RNA polymerase sigma-70 factor (ECF subfamily)
VFDLVGHRNASPSLVVDPLVRNLPTGRRTTLLAGLWKPERSLSRSRRLVPVMARVDPAFLGLYEAEYGTVFRTVFLLCRNADLAEEATQEAFVRAFERWKRLRDQPWAAGWITTTAMNVARRALRRQDATGPRAAADATDTDAAIDLWRSVAGLPLRQQQALVLHYRLGMPTAEAAAVMHCAEGTVRAYLTRARDALRERLQEEPDGTRPNR